VNLIDALELHLAMEGLDEARTFFWIDLFSIRQRDIATDVIHIGAIIRHVGRMVSVIEPWDRPVCLQRVWCLYEMMHGHLALRERLGSGPQVAHSTRTTALSKGSKLACHTTETGRHSAGLPRRELSSLLGEDTDDCSASVSAQAPRVPPSAPVPRRHALSMPPPRASAAAAMRQFGLTMPPSERDAFQRALETDSARVVRALTSFDAREAQASVHEDRERILELIASRFAPSGLSGAQLRAQGRPREHADHEAALDTFNATVRSAVRDAIAGWSWGVVLNGTSPMPSAAGSPRHSPVPPRWHSAGGHTGTAPVSMDSAGMTSTAGTQPGQRPARAHD